MSRFGSVLASAALVVAVGCGENNDNNVRLDGATSPGVDSGTSPSVDGAADDAPVSNPDLPSVDGDGVNIDGGNSVDGGAGICTMPSCMASTGESCVPSGTCIAASVTDPTTSISTTSSCYSNGVTMVQSSGAAGTTITFKNATGVCHSMFVDRATLVALISMTAASIPVNNSAGVKIATLSVDLGKQQVSVTCEGSAEPFALDPACMSILGVTGSSSCTPGTCAP